MIPNTLLDLQSALNFNELIDLKFKLFEKSFDLKEDFYTGLEVLLSLSLLLDYCLKPALISNVDNLKLSKKIFGKVQTPTEVFSKIITLTDELIDQCQNNTRIVMIECKSICVPYNICYLLKNYLRLSSWEEYKMFIKIFLKSTKIVKHQSFIMKSTHYVLKNRNPFH